MSNKLNQLPKQFFASLVAKVNKKIATEKILELVEKSLIKPKPRKATKPSKRQIEKRITAKKQISEKKDMIDA